MKSKRVIENQRGIYDSQIKKYGDSPKSTHNQLVEIQNLRFERLLSKIDLKNYYTIHDVGCGICDLYQYLIERKSNLIYSGTDIVPAMKELVNSKYPKVDYYIRDIIEDNIKDKYDYVVLSGTFNLPGDINQKDWKEFCHRMIISMFKIAKKGIAFNFLTKKADYYNPKMYYQSVEEIFNFCLDKLSRFVHIDHSYPLYEFSCTILKTDAVKEIHDHNIFDKYFNV